MKLVVRDGLSEELTFELRPEYKKEAVMVRWGKITVGRKNS